MASRIQNGENINSQTVWNNKLFSFGFLREGLEVEGTTSAEDTEPVIEDTPTDQETAETTTPETTPAPGEGASGKTDGASGKTESVSDKPDGASGKTGGAAGKTDGAVVKPTSMFDRGLTSDANYKNVNLPSLDAPTRKSNSWKPPINQTYTSRPNGENAKPGSTSDSIYSPAKDQDFIRTTIAKIADIITPPPPVPLPKPTRPPESFQTNETSDDADSDSEPDTREPLSAMDGISGNKLKSSSDVPEKQKRLISSWRSWVKDTSKVSKLKKAVTVTLNSIYETFYIPELIAVGIVNPSYNLNDIKSFYSREDYVAATQNHKYDEYNQDVVTLTKQIKLFVMTAFTFFAAFNWWYLIIYTQHYLDINEFLVMESFTPINWILGPALGATAGLNYYLLGKRLQKKYYESVMEPIINNKWISFTVYLLIFMGLYQKFAKTTSGTFDDIMKGEPNEFFTFLIAFGFIYYLFGVPSKGLFSPFWVNLFKLSSTVGVIFSFIYVVILFILMMVMLKFAILFIILFFMFYSYWSIIVLGDGGPINFFSNIFRIIADTSETCDVPNPFNDPFISLMTWFKKNLTYILISIIYFGLIVQLMDDTSKNIIKPAVKGKCHTIYTLLLVVQIFMILWINRERKQMVNIDDILANVKEGTKASDSPILEFFGKIFTIIRLVLSNITNSVMNITNSISNLFPKATPEPDVVFNGVAPTQL